MDRDDLHLTSGKSTAKASHQHAGGAVYNGNLPRFLLSLFDRAADGSTTVARNCEAVRRIIPIAQSNYNKRRIGASLEACYLGYPVFFCKLGGCMRTICLLTSPAPVNR